jgi:phosphate transport system protein
MALLSVVRNLERLADHATNIAEEVIFFLTGSDIRHSRSVVTDERLNTEEDV